MPINKNAVKISLATCFLTKTGAREIRKTSSNLSKKTLLVMMVLVVEWLRFWPQSLAVFCLTAPFFFTDTGIFSELL